MKTFVIKYGQKIANFDDSFETLWHAKDSKDALTTFLDSFIDPKDRATIKWAYVYSLTSLPQETYICNPC